MIIYKIITPNIPYMKSWSRHSTDMRIISNTLLKRGIHPDFTTKLEIDSSRCCEKLVALMNNK